MRAEVVLAVRSLADPAYQQRVWIPREYPQDTFFDDFTHRVNVLFDDTGVLPYPSSAVGDILYPSEVTSLTTLGCAQPLIGELGNANDAQYLRSSTVAKGECRCTGLTEPLCVKAPFSLTAGTATAKGLSQRGYSADK